VPPIPSINLDNFMQTERIYSVNEITHIIKSVIEDSDQLRDVGVRGEITNFYFQQNAGHMYFDLKSKNSKIKCVSFRGMNRNFKFMPTNGMKVIVRGYVTIYEVRGEYQIMVKDIRHDGVGNLHEEYEKLKAKLKAEGLFEEETKLPIPLFPKRIGIASGAGSAALHDIIKIINRRYPCVELFVVPTVVQGLYAKASIISSMEMLNSLPDLDVIILGRGGGSLEDLWAFNLEPVVRSVFNSRVPVITGIGHQTDFTLCDFVSDMRAPTPSTAAEMAVPDRSGLLKRIKELERTAVSTIKNKLEKRKFRLDSLKDNILLRDPERLLSGKIQHHDELNSRLKRFGNTMLRGYDERLKIYDRSAAFQRPFDHIKRLKGSLAQLFFELDIYFKNRFSSSRDMCDLYTKAVYRNSPAEIIKRLGERIEINDHRLLKNINHIIKFRKKSVENGSVLIKSLSPDSVLHRGYALVLDRDGHAISDAEKTKIGDIIEVRFRSSGLHGEVKDKEVDIHGGSNRKT